MQALSDVVALLPMPAKLAAEQASALPLEQQQESFANFVGRETCPSCKANFRQTLGWPLWGILPEGVLVGFRPSVLFKTYRMTRRFERGPRVVGARRPSPDPLTCGVVLLTRNSAQSK